MSKERIKPEHQPIIKPEAKPKTREVSKEPIIQVKQDSETQQKRIISSEKNYDKIKAFNDSKRPEINDKLKNNSIRWAYYAVDGDTGYQYYFKLNK